jgi:two-component system, OmpR family, sensor histidine kinase SenX3
VNGVGAVVVVVAAIVAVVAMLAVTVRSQRRVRHRIEEALGRLEVEGALHGRGLEDVLGRFERVIEQAEGERGSARRRAGRLASALAAVPQGVVVCDTAGREQFRNAMAAEFVDARHTEALVEQAVQELLDAALGGEPAHRELDLLGPPRRLLVVTALPLAAPDGDPVGGAVAVIEDVSGRRRLEEMRRDFVANLSHELKTPVGALGLLAETLAGEDDPLVARRLAERMTGEAFRVSRTIDDLLDLSRIEADEAPQREVVPVEAVVTEAVERVRPLAERRAVTLHADDIARRHTVRGDRRQLVSAMANLLENACIYSDEGSAVEVRSRADGTWVELEVRDHGIGIPRRDLERIFERFYRVDRARSRATGGTGLGLAIVRHVAQNHDGEVRVQSSEGEGSVFTMRLPSGPGPVALPEVQAEAG